MKGARVVAAAGGVAAMAWLLSKRRNYDFAGKVVLITGGSRGLGLVLARQFISEEDALLVDVRDAPELGQAGKLMGALQQLSPYGDQMVKALCKGK